MTNIIIEKYHKWLYWREDKEESFLDVGSGPGDIVRAVIYPCLPANFSRLVLSDISEPMIELEKKNFKGCDRVSCEVLDIGTKISEQKLKDLGTFDHVMSFFCLMWVPDQETAMENIFKLVKPRGDCFIVLAANSTILDAVTSVCESPRWKEYFIGWQDFYAFPYRKLDEAKEKGMKFLKNAGFVDIKADLMTNYIKFLSDEQKVNFLSSMPNKFSKEVTKEEENEIIKERIQHLTKSQQAAKDDDNAGKYDVISTYLILYGKKVE
ncbi:juvenile hormone acid O-methyltransferase-like [Phlebotomus papatasi]|uniref:juvenile hormone acid O-methyltransferase-like n=1 Tax=Phlebotomus papatasi TaxID=29031 RepID=UPI00248368D0|nr:juvenile hormone acid O-methyltransferase-like [Phlebotomus papatasi]